MQKKASDANDVATILMRRVALEISDSEDSEEDKDEHEWD
jgi:hypothetical protein